MDAEFESIPKQRADAVAATREEARQKADKDTMQLWHLEQDEEAVAQEELQDEGKQTKPETKTTDRRMPRKYLSLDAHKCSSC